VRKKGSTFYPKKVTFFSIFFLLWKNRQYPNDRRLVQRNEKKLGELCNIVNNNHLVSYRLPRLGVLDTTALPTTIPNGQDTPRPWYIVVLHPIIKHMNFPLQHRGALNPGLDQRPFLCSLPMVMMTDHSNSSSFGTSATVLDVAIARSHESRVPSGHGGAVETPTQVRSGLSCHPEFAFETPI